MKQLLQFGLGTVLICLFALGAVRTGTEDARTPRKAIERSLPYLERDGFAWMEGRIAIQDGQACVSCHQVPFALWSLTEARRRGIAPVESKVDKLYAEAVGFLSRPGKARVMSLAPIVLGRDAEGGLGDAWNALLQSDLNPQKPAGHWQAKGQFPQQNRDVAESDAIATMWTMLAIASFAAIDESDQARLDLAMSWVEANDYGESNEWLLTRLLLDHEFDAPGGSKARVQELLRLQNADGGWSWLPGDESNAYSTGQSLYALSRTGLAPDHTVVQKAVDYLLRAQRADGTWFVDSELTSATGSEAKDYVYTYWGTAWAVIGLARTLATVPEAGLSERTGQSYLD